MAAQDEADVAEPAAIALWRHVVLYFASQPLQIEGPLPEAEEAEQETEGEPEPPKPPLVTFDPYRVLKEKVADDIRFIFLSKSDLPEVTPEAVQAKIADLAQAAAEKAVERRKQEEALRNEADAEATEGMETTAPTDGEPPPTGDVEPLAPTDVETEPYIDGVLVLEGFDEDFPIWLQQDTAVDIHALLSLDGITIDEEEQDEKIVRTKRAVEGKDALVQSVQDAVHRARMGHWAQNVRIERIKNIHETSDRMVSCVWEAANNLAERRQDYNEWIEAAKVRPLEAYQGKCEQQWYKHLMDSVDPVSLDVPMMLSCLVEQVRKNCDAVEDHAAQIESLEEYMCQAGQIAYTDELGEATLPDVEDARDEARKKAPIVHSLDCVSQKHMGRSLPCGTSYMDICNDVVGNLRVPGCPSRLNFPPCLTEQERSADRHRIYPFLQDLSPLEIERVLLLDKFRTVMTSLGYVDVNMEARMYHEKLTVDCFSQVLSRACFEEPNMAIEYYPRHDALLVVLGCPTAAQGNSHRWCARNVCRPSFNDILHPVAIAGVDKNAELLDLDCGAYGYAQVVEHVVVGEDGSIWMEAQLCRGMRERQLVHSRVFARGFSFRIEDDKRWRIRAQEWVDKVQEEPPAVEEGEEPTEEEIEERARLAREKAESEREALRQVQGAVLHGAVGDIHFQFSTSPPIKFGKRDSASDLIITFPTGQVVVGRSEDRQLSILWPLARIELSHEPGLSCAGTSLPHFAPGNRDLDSEVERMVLKEGALVRKLLSRRREMYFPDGTVAHRNPTKEELEEALGSLPGDASADSRGYLRCLLSSVEREIGADVLAQGAPGHWVVTQLTGQRVGRIESPEEDVAEEVAEEEGDAEESEKPPRAPTLEMVLGPYDVRRIGSILEYTLPPLAVSVQVDPATHELCTTISNGLLVIDSADDTKRACLLADGTVITTQRSSVTIENAGIMPSVVCDSDTISARMYDGTTVMLGGSDGTLVTPLQLDAQYIRARCLPHGLVEFCGGLEGSPTQTFEADLCASTVTAHEESRTIELSARQRIVLRNSAGECIERKLRAEPLAVEGPMTRSDANPRLFVVYSSGEAEELLTQSVMEECLLVAEEKGGTILRDQALGPPLYSCLAHSIFGPGCSVPPPCTVDLPFTIPPVIRAKDPTPPPSVAAHEFVTFRQFIEYPKLYEDRKAKFDEGLKAFEIWEKKQLETLQELGKKEKKKDDKKAKKGGKKKGKSAGAEAPPEVAAEPVSTHPQLRLSVREHRVSALTYRSKWEFLPSSSAMQALAIATISPDACATKIQKVFRGRRTRRKLAAAAVGEEEPPMAEIQTSLSVTSETRAHVPTHEAVPTFQYFESFDGIQFLMDNGFLQDHKPFVPHSPLSPISTCKKLKSSWRPPRVYEEEDFMARPSVHPEDFEKTPGERVEPPGDTSTATPPDSPRAGPNKRPSRPATPEGPHPDKTNIRFNNVGKERPPPKAMPKAMIQNNLKFMEREGPVDRRVRTVSVIHKKNACFAPAVQDVRKSGAHVLQGTVSGLARARGIVPEPDLPTGPAAWHLSSTQQGLGSSNYLIEIIPGSCRFGPLRVGSVYRMVFNVKNLDVDSTRFLVKLIKPQPYVKILHKPGTIAPGISTKITVEIIASEAGEVDSIVEVTTKAHIARVAVAGRIMSRADYDRLDAESMALHGRHIGYCGKSVEVVQDEAYCIKMLGDAYGLSVSDAYYESD